MIKLDEVINSLDKVLDGVAGFERNGYFQINGLTTFTDIEQVNLNDSKFSFDFNNQSILHFTNLEALRLILESKSLRASNLDKFDDELELIHALSLSKINSDFIKKEKAFKFALSFTKNNEPVKNKSYHWVNYANNHKGAALEFQIDSAKLPFNIFSLNINYIKETNESDLISKIEKMDLSEVTLNALIPLFCAVKRGKYKEEDEIRIFINGDKNVIESMHFGDKSNYIFQLNSNNEINYFKMVPIIYNNEVPSYEKFLRLKKIYLGKNSSLNFGQEYRLRYLYDYCDKNEIEWINLD